jgi:hypothetical protein
MSDSKKQKASKQTAPQTRQLDFLPQRVLYPAELESASEPVVTVMEGDERTGVKVPKTYVRIDRIVNLPTEVTRYSPEEWQEQMESFRTSGIRTAIDLRPVEGGFWVEEGRHRILGALELGRRYIKADIDTKGTAVTSAVWRLDANAMRKGDRPLDVAVGLKEMMDPEGANLTQEQVAEWAKTSPATVSRLLRLLKIPRELAALVGSKVETAWLEPLFCVLEDAALLEAASNAVLPAAERGSIRGAEEVHRLMASAWAEKELALPEESVNADIRDDAAWKKQRNSLKPFKVKVPNRYDGKATEVAYLRKVPEALKLAQEVSDRLDAEQRAEEERLRRKAAKEGKKVKKEPDGTVRVVEAPKRRSLAERVPEQRTKVQLDLLARHIPAQVSFPEDLVAEALARFVQHTSALMANQDMEAARRALNLPAPEKEDGRTPNLHFRREDFLSRWTKDRVEGLRVVAVCLYFQARDHHKQLKDGTTEYGVGGRTPEPRLPVWLTGKTFDEATEIAKQAIKDRDAGFKSVVDGALCDHCDDAATLRREGVNVCRSEVFKGINKDPKALATLRLRRKEAKAAHAAQDAPAAPENAEPAKPETAAVEEGPEPEAPESAPVEPADKAPEPSEPAQATTAPASKRKSRKAAAGA